MSDLLQTIKSFGLTEFYFSLSITDKNHLEKYSKYLIWSSHNAPNCDQGCQECFIVTNGSRFLWATAANAIPDKKYDFAECLLIHALSIAANEDDLAWIHANLAQVYYDKHKTDREAAKKSVHHCRELIKLGYMKPWAQNMMEEILVFQA